VRGKLGAVLRLVSLVALVVAASSCGEDAVSVDEVTVVRGSTPGLLTKVEDARLTLAPEDGSDAQRFGIRQVDRPRLDLFHLEEHVREEWPLIVFWEDVGGTRFAVRVDDA
jgi:hypothetical protein